MKVRAWSCVITLPLHCHFWFFPSSKIFMRWVANDIWFPSLYIWGVWMISWFLMGYSMTPGFCIWCAILTLDFSQKEQLGCLSVFWLLALFTASNHNQPRSWSQMTSVPNTRATFCLCGIGNLGSAYFGQLTCVYPHDRTIWIPFPDLHLMFDASLTGDGTLAEECFVQAGFNENDKHAKFWDLSCWHHKKCQQKSWFFTIS